MKRIIRDRRLTPDEAAKYKTIRDQIAEELLALIERHHKRTAALDNDGNATIYNTCPSSTT